MPDLNQIVGAILRDITEARTAADFATREVSSYYGNDEIMKYFPVPRVDIHDVTIDLRFAVGSVANDENRQTDKKAKLNDLSISFSQKAASETIKRIKDDIDDKISDKNFLTQFGSSKNEQKLAELFHGSFEGRQNSAEALRRFMEEAANAAAIVKEAETGPFSIIKSEKGFIINAKNRDGQTVLVSQETFNTRVAALAAIEDLAKRSAEKQIQIESRGPGGKIILKETGKGLPSNLNKFEILPPDMREFAGKGENNWERFIKGNGLEQFLTSQPRLRDEIKPYKLPDALQAEKLIDQYSKQLNEQKNLVERNMNPLKVEVLINSADLQGIPDAAVSSLKFTTSIKNYIWSIDENNNPESLIPEP